MATTYSNDLGIKKIGTGLEAGTWGASTNQNFERFSDSIGRSVSLDITAMPDGSTTSTGLGSPSDAVWVLLDSSDSLGTISDGGSEGRCAAVELVDTTNVLTTIGTLKIRGTTTSTNVNRTFLVWNNLATEDIKLDCAGGEYTLKNGAMAWISTVATTTGGWTAGVQNLLNNAQIDNMVLSAATGKITFVGTGTIAIKPSSATALVINDGTTDLIKVNTSTEAITLNTSGADTKVDLSGGNAKDSIISINAQSADSLKFVDVALAATHFHIDTNSDEVIVGETGGPIDLRVWGDIIVDDAAHEITIKDAQAGALSIKSTDNSEYLNILSSATVGSRRLNVIVPIETPDIMLTGTDGYINGTTLQGSTGYGLRNGGGAMESKVDTNAAWNPIIAALVAVDITGAATQAIAAATSADGEEKQGCIDIGPMRLIFNTVDLTSNTIDVTLGDAGSGTGATMSAALWTVMVVDSDNTDTGANQNASCTVTGSAAGTFTIKVSSGTDHCTYWAIGDSGA
jgi:hypothetical protein